MGKRFLEQLYSHSGGTDDVGVIACVEGDDYFEDFSNQYDQVLADEEEDVILLYYLIHIRFGYCCKFWTFL